MPKYRVNLYYSGYLDVETEAESEDTARSVAETVVMEMSPAEFSRILGTLERWEDADTVTHES